MFVVAEVSLQNRVATAAVMRRDWLEKKMGREGKRKVKRFLTYHFLYFILDLNFYILF